MIARYFAAQLALASGLLVLFTLIATFDAALHVFAGTLLGWNGAFLTCNWVAEGAQDTEIN